jgi:hypothetical protein
MYSNVMSLEVPKTGLVDALSRAGRRTQSVLGLPLHRQGTPLLNLIGVIFLLRGYRQIQNSGQR